MGIPDDDTGAAQDDEGEARDERFAVWPENARALAAFLAVRTLWRYHPMGGVLGLDRSSVESEWRMRAIDVGADLLDDIAAIERGVIEVWNAKK